MLEQAIQTPRDVRRFMRMIGHLSRADIGAVIDASIAALDARDGDPELEDDRSDFEPVEIFQGDPSWCEWHTLPAAIRRAGSLNSKPLDSWRTHILEDEEDEDQDEIDGDEADHGNGEDEVGNERPWACSGPGCILSDAGEPETPDLPAYDLDQSLGPINQTEVMRAYYRRMRTGQALS